jgi:hypothetical protein
MLSFREQTKRVCLLGVGATGALTLVGMSLYAHPTPGNKPSQDKPGSAVVLFSGKEEELKRRWRKRYVDQPATWKILSGGAMVVQGGDIVTRQEFSDFHLHLEFRTPDMPNAKGQAKGNSGIGLHGRYEVQILDSYGIEAPGTGDCGALYNQAGPLINACKPPREWQTYDIVFRGPRLDAEGKVIENPRVTVIQNGIPVQNNQELKGPTGIQFQQYKGMPEAGPIVLQDHGNPVEFRNIWLVPLPEKGSEKY